MNETRLRVITLLVVLGAGTAILLLLYVILPDDAAVLLLDKERGSYPLTVQNIMWLVFFMGLGELWLRFRATESELKQLKQQFLPEDDRTLLQAEDLGAIHQRIHHQADLKQQFLPRLIKRIILQFHSSKAIDQANNILNSSIDLFLHEIDLRYNLLRYIQWLIPTLGFIGTVIGIALALNYAGSTPPSDPQLLNQLTQKLGVAFYTTLLALVLSAILVFIMSVIQGREEYALNQAGQYCLDNLINRLVQ